MESQEIKLPAAPKIEQQEPGPDKRRFAVVPFVAVWDRNINPFQFRVLAALAAFANRAGVCYVSSYRLADMLKTTRPRISIATSALKKAGYIKQIGKPVVGVRGATLQILFEPDMDIAEAVAIASKGSEEDLRPPGQREQELAEMMADDDKEWTEQELRENKERLARMLLQAFKTPADKPRLYEPVKGDTQAVKQIKQEIRARMRQLRKEQLREQLPVSEKEPKHRNNSLGIETDTGASIGTDTDVSEQVLKQEQSLDMDTIVGYLNNELFNGVKSESDMQGVAWLAEIGVSRATLDRYLNQYPGDTAYQLAKRIINAA